MSVVATPTPAPPPQEPAPTPTPEFRSQLARTMAAATEADAATADASVLGGAAYGAVGRYQAHREQVQMAEQEKRQADEEQNRIRMEAIRSDFAPRIEDLGAGVTQAAAFRAGIQNRPYYEVLEEERLNEGSRRAGSFGQAMDKLSPDQQGAFRTMAAGLEKEGLDPKRYQGILEGYRSGADLPPDTTPDLLESANRVFRSTEGEDLAPTPRMEAVDRPPVSAERELELRRTGDVQEVLRARGEQLETARAENQAALVAQYGSLGAIPDEEYNKYVVYPAGEPAEAEPLTLGTIGNFVKGLFTGGPTEAIRRVRAGEPVLGETPAELFDLVPQEQRQVAATVLDAAGGAVNMFLGPDSLIAAFTQPALEVEQEIFTPFTEPIVIAALRAVGVPNAEAIGREIATVIVPSSVAALATGPRMSLWARRFARGVQEGAINVLQENAVRAQRGMPPLSSAEGALMYGAGFAGGAALPELIPALSRLPRAARGVAEQIGPPIRRVPEAPPLAQRVTPLEPEAVTRPVAEAAVPEAPIEARAAGVPLTRRGAVTPELEGLNRAEFEQSVLYRGVRAQTKQFDTFWTADLGLARSHAGKTPGARIRIMLRSDVPEEAITFADEAATKAPSLEAALRQRGIHGLELPERSFGPTRVIAEIGVDEDPYEALVRRAAIPPQAAPAGAAAPVTREPISVGRANTEIQRGVTDIQTATRQAPDVPIGRLERIDWSRRRATLVDARGQSVERRLDDLEFFREAAAEAPPVRAAPEVATRLPTRTLADIERAPDIIYTAQGPSRAAEILAGRRTKDIWGTKAPENVANTGEEGSTILAMRVREGAEPVRAVPRIKDTVAYRPEDLMPVSRMPLEEVYDPATIRLARPIRAAEEVAPARAVPPSEAFPTTEIKPFRTKVQRANNAVNRATKAHADAPRGQRAARLADVTEAKKAHREALADLKRVQAANKKALNDRARLASRVERAKGTAAERRATAEATRTGRAAQRAVAAETFAELMETQGPLVERMRSVVMKLARMQAGRALEITAGRRGQAARLSRAIMAGRRRGLTGAEALRFERTALRGKLPKGEFQLPEEVFSSAEQETLIRAAQDALRNEGLVFEAGNIRAILTDKLFPGKLLDITPGEISLLDRVFGGDFALNLSALIGMRKPSIVDQLVSVVHFPRNVLAGLFDQSGLLRQGGFMAITQNRAWRANATRYYRAFFSEDFAQARATQLMKDPNFAYLDEIGVYMPLPGRMAAGEEVLLGRDEATFLGRLLNHGAETMMEKAGVPLTLRKVLGRQLGSRAATDGMITFLSGLRRDTSVDMLVQLLSREDRLAYSMADAAGRVGILREGVETADAKAIASFVNSATGRGTLGPLNPITRVLNLPFFAPRFVAGQITRFGPAFDPSISLTARKLILRELGKYYGTLTTVMGLVGLAGWEIEQATGMVPIRVEWDPRSTDWGKVKAGPLRVDLTSGALPLFRTAVQIATGQRKTALGDIQDIEVGTAALNLIRSKLSPAAGVAWSGVTGKTFIGEDLSPEQIAHDIFMPIVFQDIEEAVREGGAWHVLPSLLSFTGIGIVSYTSPSVRTKEMIHEAFMTGLFNPADYKDIPEGIPDLLPLDRENLRKLDPDLFDKLARAAGETVAGIGERGQRAFMGELGRVGREQAVAGIEAAADVFRRTENGKGFRDSVDSAFLRLRGLRSVLEEERETLGLEARERTGPVWDDLSTFFDIFDRYPQADSDPREREGMFEDIERFYAGIGTARADAIERQLGLPFKEVPVYADLRDDKRLLREAGYWDIGEQAWELIVAETREGRVRAGAAPLPATRREHEEQLVAQTRGLPPYERDEIIDQDPDLREYRRTKTALNEEWLAAHTDLIPLLDRWGYRELAASDVGLTEPTFRVR